MNDASDTQKPYPHGWEANQLGQTPCSEMLKLYCVILHRCCTL